MNAEAVSGKTRWRLFGLLLLVMLLLMGLLLVALQKGALAASFTVSGVTYKASADRFNADGVAQYGSVDQSAKAAHPVFVNGFKDASANNFCQSFEVPVPVVGSMTVRIDAPGQNGFAAQNLVLGIDNVSGDISFDNVEIGRDAGDLNKGPHPNAQAGTFGIQSDELHIDHLHQEAWSTTAGSLKLNSVGIKSQAGHHDCF